jgi:MFS family permease
VCSDVTPDPAAAEEPPRFRGWWVVGGLLVILAVSSGLGFYGASVYKDALTEEHGFSETAVSIAVTLQFVTGGLLGMFVARLMGRTDARRIIVVGAVLGGFALIGLGRAEELWQIYFLFALFGAGFAASGLVPATTIVTRWFVRRRSVALSITSTGLSLGGILITPLAATMIDTNGLSDAMPILGTVFIIGIVPVAWLVVRSDPRPLGQYADGDPAPLDGRPLAAVGSPYKEAIHTPFFKMSTAAYVLVMLAQVGGIAHLFTVAKDRVDADTAALCVSVLAGASVVARLAGGWVATRVSLRPLVVFFAVLQIAGLVAIAVAGSRGGMVAAAALFGASVGNLLMLQPLLLADAFGVLDYARIYALAQVFTTIGVGGGPALMGVLFDASGGWGLSYAVAAVASASAGLMLYATTRPRYGTNVLPMTATSTAPAKRPAASAT